jgi:flagellar biosynthesis component FlhA
MELIALILYVAGLVVLLIACFPAQARVNLIALGLLLIFGALLLSGVSLDIDISDADALGP